MNYFNKPPELTFVSAKTRLTAQRCKWHLDRLLHDRQLGKEGAEDLLRFTEKGNQEGSYSLSKTLNSAVNSSQR